MVDVYWDDPQVWMFVQLRNLIAPLVWTVLLPQAQRTIHIRETVVVNRTVNLRDRGQRIAVNPGISASAVTRRASVRYGRLTFVRAFSPKPSAFEAPSRCAPKTFAAGAMLPRAPARPPASVKLLFSAARQR